MTQNLNVKQLQLKNFNKERNLKPIQKKKITNKETLSKVKIFCNKLIVNKKVKMLNRTCAAF